MCMLKEPN